MHQLLSHLLEVPLEDLHVPEGCRYNEVVHRIVDQHVCDKVGVLSRLNILQVGIVVLFLPRRVVLFHCGNHARLDPLGEVLEDHRECYVVRGVRLCAKLVKVGRSVRPADEVARGKIQRHPLDPLADPLEPIAVVVGGSTLALDLLDRDRVTLGVEKDCLLGRVSVRDL